MRFFNLRKSALGSAVLALKVTIAAAQEAQAADHHPAGDMDPTVQSLALIALVIAGTGICCCYLRQVTHANEQRDNREIPDSYNTHRLAVSPPQERDIGDSYITMPQSDEHESPRPSR
jgi:hypothetical protein